MNTDFLKRLHITLCTISSNYDIDHEKLKEFNQETLELYVREYPWYYMPQGVHKMLMHSHQVVSVKCVPLGSLSEEPQEASNKIFKKSRESFTRKTSRENTNKDLMTRLLCLSDPSISNIRRSKPDRKESRNLPREALDLLKD